MSRLNDMVVVVADDTGRESADIVNTFLNAGATVVLFAHVETVDDGTRDFIVSSDDDGLVTVTGDFKRIHEVERLRDEILDRFDRIDALIVSIGTQVHIGQRIVEMSLDTYWSALTGHLLRNFVVTRTFYPVVAEAPGGGHCVFVNEDGGEIPRSHAGPQCIAAAAQRMFMRMLLEESNMTDRTPRISEICSYSRPDSGFDSITSLRNDRSIDTVVMDIVSDRSDMWGEVVRV